jgi:hypothetical protein
MPPLTIHHAARTLLFKAALFSLLIGGSRSLAMPTNNLEIIAVPAPGRVVVDGSLEDWDLSGSIFSCPDTDVFASTAAVRTAAMFDAEGLYVACHWVDPTPLANQTDPDEPGKADHGWTSDCLQLRVLTDTQIHLTAWQYAAKKKSALHVQFGTPAKPTERPELARGLEAGAKMAFKVDTDGKGYTQELFLPWKLLSASGKPFKAGEAIGFGLHFNWGGGDNKTWRAAEWQDVVSGPKANRTFFWQDPGTWGKLRFSAVGKLTLPPQPWDAVATGPDLTTHGDLDIRYNLPADGKTTLVIEDEHGKRIRNLIGAYPRHAGANVDRWDGLDDRGKPAPAGNYRWRGLFNPGIDVRYATHLFPHTNPPWRNAAGTGGWGADHTPPSYVAADGERVYLLYSNAEGGSALVGCDLQGHRLWGQGGAFQGGGLVCFASGPTLYYADAEKLTRIDTATGKAQPFVTGIEHLPIGPGAQPPTGIAFHGERLYLASAAANAIRVFDLTTDKRVKDIALPSPMGLAVDEKGGLLVASGDSILRVDVEDGKTTAVVQGGVRDVGGLAVARDGSIHVVNGATQQVFSFSADGKKLRETGTRGGRAPLGKWDRDGLLMPTSVGIDGEGNLWVAEADPVAKRLSRWGSDGRCIGEWLGPSPYGGDGIVDHADKSRVYCGGLEFTADYTHDTARPAAVHLRGLSEGQPAVAGAIAAGSFWVREGFTTTFQGHDYLCYDPGLLCIKRGDRWVPAAAIGFVKAPEDQLLWSDRNGDGKVQDDEISPLPAGLGFNTRGAGGWGVLWSRRDLSTMRSIGDGRAIRFTPSGFTSDGVPIFDSKSASVVKLPIPGCPVDVDDDTMIAFYEDSHAPEVAALRDHPLGDMAGIKAYNRAGEIRWTYPQPFSGVHGSFRAPLPTLPGQVIGTIYIMGTAETGGPAGKVVCFNGYYGQRFLFTTDGLFVQSLFKDGRSLPTIPDRAEAGMVMNDMSPGAEAYAGTFSRNADGNFYLTGGFTGPMCVVMRVEGLDKVQRLAGGALTLTDEVAQRGLAERRQREAAAAAPAKTLHVVKGSPVVDGDLADWNLETDGVSIPAGTQPPARAALAHDDEFLYAAFRVSDPTPWINHGSDAKVLFLGGDSVDIRLGLDPKAAAARQQPVAGDTRIAIATQGGKAVVMLYQEAVPGHVGPRFPFISPVGRVEMDRVEAVADARVAVKVDPAGYTLEAAIPLKALGQPLPVGADIRADVGVLYSDQQGTRCVLRSYWSNRDTNVTADLPSEARLQPGNWGPAHVD